MRFHSKAVSTIPARSEEFENNHESLTHFLRLCVLCKPLPWETYESLLRKLNSYSEEMQFHSQWLCSIPAHSEQLKNDLESLTHFQGFTIDEASFKWTWTWLMRLYFEKNINKTFFRSDLWRFGGVVFFCLEIRFRRSLNWRIY